MLDQLSKSNTTTVDRPEPRPIAKSDPALQVCECGKQFRAPVTTHVTCPRCRREQPW